MYQKLTRKNIRQMHRYWSGQCPYCHVSRAYDCCCEDPDVREEHDYAMRQGPLFDIELVKNDGKTINLPNIKGKAFFHESVKFWRQAFADSLHRSEEPGAVTEVRFIRHSRVAGYVLSTWVMGANGRLSVVLGGSK